MKEFSSLSEAGRQLAPLVSERVASWFDPVLVPVLPNGVPVVVGLRASLHLPVVGLTVVRSEAGVEISAPGDVAGRTAIVIDDGVETGTVARAAAPALRAAGVAHLVLAVPVCPREASAQLNLIYDEVLAVTTPMVRRSLAWHYEDFDTIEEEEALRLLEGLPS